jgi:hypothetical protein
MQQLGLTSMEEAGKWFDDKESFSEKRKYDARDS